MHAEGTRRPTVNEDGFATIAVIGVMTVALAFTGVAAIASVTTLRGSVRDEDSKLALAAADAGSVAAIAHQNSIAASIEDPCLQPGTGGVLVNVAPGADGWCPPVTGSVDGATYSYQVTTDPGGALRIVSVGSSDDVNRRIELRASDSAGSNVFADATLIGLDWINMDSNAVAEAGAATDGSISLNSNSQLCGSASVGIGGEVNGSSQHRDFDCLSPPPPVTEEPLTLAPVQQGDVVTNNSNDRFFEQDLIGGQQSRVVWDPDARTLELKSNVSLTLGGSNYSLCKLKLGSNSTIYIAEGADVRVFFDAPENCGGETVPLEMHSNSRIIATGGDATKVALLFVGSDVISTTIKLSSNSQPSGDCSSEFVVYAPKTDIDVNSNVTYCGAIAGQSVNVDSNSVIESQQEATSFQLPGAGPHYTVDRFVECTTTSPGTTGEGC
jgi:hypothetical protein